MEIKEYTGDFLQRLRAFYYLATTKSFSKAAEKVHRNQGTLTYQIKKLEEDLQVHLVNRKITPVELTEKGDLLYQISLDLFKVMNRINVEIAEDGALSGNIQILCNYGLSSQYLPEYLYEFKALFPEVKLQIIPEKNANVVKRMSEPSIDFVITRSDFIEGKNCQFYPLFESPLALVVPKGTVISQKPTVSELAKLVYISVDNENTLDKAISNLLMKNNYTIQYAIIESYFLASLKYVELGLGAAIMDYFLANTKGYDVDIYSLAHLMEPQFYGVAVKNNQYISPQAQSLLQFLQERCK